MTALVEDPGRPAWALSGEEILAELDALHHAQTRLAARRLDLLRHLDDLGHAKDLGARDTVELLALRHRLDPHTVRRDLRTAHALPRYPTVTTQLPGTQPPATLLSRADADAQSPDGQLPGAAADGEAARGADAGAVGVDGGERDHRDGADELASMVDRRRGALARETVLNPAQAAVITEILEKAPPTVRPADLAVAETELVIAARTVAPRDLRRLGTGVLNALDPDGPAPRDGISPEEADRTDPAELAHAAQTLWFTPGSATSPNGVGARIRGLRIGGFMTGESAELFQVLIDAAAKPRKTPTGELDPRTLGQRRADAFTTVLRAAASTGGEIPAHGGIKPHLSITIPYAALANAVRTRRGTDQPSLFGPMRERTRERPPDKAATIAAFGTSNMGDVIFGEPLPASDVRRIACDAGVIPIVLGSASEPLDVGREHRLVTPALRRALIARDSGCVIPGCGAPPGHCDAHHLIHWADGGTTSIDNLALACTAHHRAIHRGTWTVTITDNRVHITRPSWTSPGRSTKPTHEAPRSTGPPD
jgi:hypothetical protein